MKGFWGHTDTNSKDATVLEWVVVIIITDINAATEWKHTKLNH